MVALESILKGLPYMGIGSVRPSMSADRRVSKDARSMCKVTFKADLGRRAEKRSAFRRREPDYGDSLTFGQRQVAECASLFRPTPAVR